MNRQIEPKPGSDAPQKITPTDFRRILIRAVLLPLVLSVALAGIFFWQINRLLSAAGWVEHTDEVIAQANLAQKLLIDMETGVRGYLITNDHAFLEPYEQAEPKVSPLLASLRQLTSDSRRKAAITRAASLPAKESK